MATKINCSVRLLIAVSSGFMVAVKMSSTGEVAISGIKVPISAATSMALFFSHSVLDSVSNWFNRFFRSSSENGISLS